MKKLTVLMLLLCLVTGLVSCAASEKADDSKSTAESSVTEAVSSVAESSEPSESEASENGHPENVIYNTSEKESYGVRFDFEGNYAFAAQFGDHPTDEPQIKTLIGQNKGKDDVCFLVGLYPIPRDCDWEENRLENKLPEKDERIAVIKSAEKYLNGIGFDTYTDHQWSYTAHEDGDDLPVFALIGYMTADMISSINDPDHKYVILHLPSDSDWEEFWSSEIHEGISFGNIPA